MIKFDERFREAIESGRKTHTFRTSQKGIPGTVEPIVFSMSRFSWVQRDAADGYIRITGVSVKQIGDLSFDAEGFNTVVEMLRYFRETSQLTFSDTGYDHDFEYIGKEPTT